MIGRPRTAPETRFWPKLEKLSNGCWEWVAGRSVHGYGKFWNGDATIAAHRFAYELLVGPIPDDLQVDHLCRNRACVNPAHMELVTGRENTLRGETLPAANVRRTSCPRGHAYDGVNSRGARICRQCQREATMRWKARQRQ